MKFENTKVYNFEGAIRGMRNPKNSWDKSDSEYKMKCPEGVMKYCQDIGCQYDYCNPTEFDFVIGPKDLELAMKLIRAGSEHRKFMRQIIVSVDITAPLYWWKEFDTYKVGTVANSTSTMHKLASTSITTNCFEIDDYNPNLNIRINTTVDNYVQEYIDFCERLRKMYLETKDKRYWKELIRWLPESWLQKRTVTMSYENLLAMCSKGQRRGHKLNEWSGKDNKEVENFIHWARTLPYAQELIFNDELNIKPVDALSYYGIQLYNSDGTARTLDEIQSDIIKAKLMANIETSPLDN